MNSSIIEKFEIASNYARLPRVSRWMRRPVRHFTGLFQRYVLNKLGGSISERYCDLFTGDKVCVPLPAGLDIYLTGIKTHDSEIRLTRYLLNYKSEADPNQVHVAVDCGAHLGYYSLVLSSCFDKVVSFEPSPTIGKLLLRNTIDKSNVTCINAMLSDQEGMTSFYVYPVKYSEYNTGEFNAIETGFEDKVKTQTVQSVTLDNHWGKEVEPPSLIKIDVEGGELKLLKGAIRILQNHAPVIAIEFRQEKFDLLYQPIVEFLTDIGYSGHRINDEGKLILLDDVRGWIVGLKDESDNLVFSMRSPEPQGSNL